MDASSRIVEVTVYPDSALVRREADLKLETGPVTVVFRGIVPDFDRETLRVSIQGAAKARLLSAEVATRELEDDAAPRVKELEERIQAVEDEKRRLGDEAKALGEEKLFLDSVRLFSQGQLPKDLVTKVPEVAQLEALAGFVVSKTKDHFSRSTDIAFKVRELDKRLAALHSELERVSGGESRSTRSIHVELEVSAPGDCRLSASYLTGGAGWQPVYDARADFKKSQVELSSFGVVSQRTGEDWEEVEMSLSTARPSVEGSMPYVSPWLLRPVPPPTPTRSMAKKARMMQSEAFANAAPACAAAMDAEGSLCKEDTGAPCGGAAPEPVYSRSEEKGTALVYRLQRKASVPSDGSERKLPVLTQALAARFEYSACPRASVHAYLGSRVTNSKDQQLLPGPVKIFLDGDFVGSSELGSIGPGEEYDLYLGVDENVKVKREQVSKKVDTTLIAGIRSWNKDTAFEHKLTVESYKSEKIHVKLFEALPVSEHDRIKVKVHPPRPEPQERDWKDRKGVWLWEFDLEPKGKREIYHSFTIEQPQDMAVEGLDA